MRILGVLAIVATLTGCAELTAKSLPSQTIDNGFSLTGMRWASGALMLMAVKVTQSGNNTAVCGAWALPNASRGAAAELADEVLAHGELQVADETVAPSAGFFARGRWAGERLPGGKANCREFEIPWKPIYGTARPRFVVTKRTFTYVD